MSQHRNIWITGASRGIGEAIALEYARSEKAKLILSAPQTESENLATVAKKCQELSGQENVVLPFDLSSVEDINRAFEVADQAVEQIDVLVNNAGITHRSDILDTEMKIYDILTWVNYLGPVALTKLVLPAMVARKSGHILINCSINGMLPTPHRAAYVGAKHAMHGWSESLRDEMVPHGVQVTVAFPGFVNTNIAAHALTGDGKLHGKVGSQENGLSPESVALSMIEGARKGSKRMLLAGKEGWLIPLRKISPSLVSKIVRTAKVT